MTTPVEARDKLNAYAEELDRLSKQLAELSRQFDGYVDRDGVEHEGIDQEFARFVDDFKVGLYLRSQEKGSPRLPALEMQQKLAEREMPAELLGRRDGLARRQRRLEQRVRDLKVLVEAQRSILSALKVEMEAGG